MLVSFIIPAYNAADTIVRCLDSIYGLSLKREEFEVIVIDDCSTDETVSMIEQYADNHTNLILFRQCENHRQGAARNWGVKEANGEYICFVDADDAVTEGMVAAIRKGKITDADMVAIHYGKINEQGEMTLEAESLSFAKDQIFTGIEMQNKHSYWCSAPWGYVYKKEFLHNVNYPFVEDVIYEDSDFVVVHLYHARRMLYIKELCYWVHWVNTSSTRTISYINNSDYLLLGTRMLSLYERMMEDVSCTMHDVSKEEIEEFADGVLSGACWNIEKACKRLVKLKNVSEVKAFYKRVDDRVSRKELYADDRLRRYCWNAWTSICMGYKTFALMLLAILIPSYRLVKHLKR